MSTVDLFGKTAAVPASAAPAAAAGTKTERPVAEFWGNIGVTVPMVNAETGVTENVFVSLPVGIALDTMEETKMKGSNANWANMVQAKNWLLDELKKAAEGLEPGGDVIVDDLQIQIKRVSGKAAPSDGENPLLSALAGTFGKAA